MERRGATRRVTQSSHVELQRGKQPMKVRFKFVPCGRSLNAPAKHGHAQYWKSRRKFSQVCRGRDGAFRAALDFPER